MRYLLERRPSENDATIGEVSVNGAFKWFTCEDGVREPKSRPITDDPITARQNIAAWVLSWKVAGQTAIPAGSYRIVITDSLRFHRPLPLLLDVPGFEGIRIHPGNSAGHTNGCILPGITTLGEAVYQSHQAAALWQAEIQTALTAGEEVWIDIENAEDA
jgi:hypothetical protein